MDVYLRVLEIFELKLHPRGYYDGYNSSVNPAIANAFGAAAFRFGHSLVKNSISRYVEYSLWTSLYLDGLIFVW